MTMQECYEAIGGNYEAVLGRLHSEALIRRFALKFLEDQSYIQLKQALENKNYEDAFRGAHTLKGVCQNLSFDHLYEVSNELTELLRDRTGEQPGIPEAVEKVTEVYEMKAKAAGMNAHIAKPVDVELLKKVIHKLVND